MTLARILTALAAIWDVFDSVADRVGELLSDLWDHFPNFGRMADDLARFASSIIGVALGSAFSVQLNSAALLVGKACKGRLMTPYESVQFTRHCVVEAIQSVTFTNEQGIITFLAQRLGTWFWHLFKRFKFLLAIVRITSAESMIAVFTSMFKSRAVFLLFVVGFALVALLIAIAGGVVGNLMMLQAGDAPDFCLPQNSKRVWGKQSHQFRKNVRAGPD